jgi:alpha-L-fucosidase
LVVLSLAGIAHAQSAPKATPAQVQAAVALSSGIPTNATYQPNWDSLAKNGVPKWMEEARFGIMMHWGLYSSTSTHNEWDLKYIYGANAGIAQQFTTNFGPRDKFGYLDVLDPTMGPNETGAAAYKAAGGSYEPFTAAKFDPTAWAALFKESGAKYVTMSGQHHDNFATWNSQVTPFNTVNFGPHRDLIGDLCTAVRAAGMKFGIQNHGIENYDFMAQGVNGGPVGPGVKYSTGNLVTPNDFDGTLSYTDKDHVTHTLKRSDYYRPDLRTYADGKDALTHFLDDWYKRNVELIDNYHPDLLYFDNGINPRVLDPLKQKLAAYYFNQALTWEGKPQVTMAAKQKAYPSGRTEDYEKTMPNQIQAAAFQSEETLTNGSSWDYDLLGGKNSGFNTNAGTFVHDIAHLSAMNGNLILNISPKPDGTIPDEEVKVLRQIGAWLAVNGKAIYATHPWTKFAEGSTSAAAHTSSDFRFTVNGTNLYAIMMGWPSDGATATIRSLGDTSLSGHHISGVNLLGFGKVSFSQEADGLKITLPKQSELADPNYAYAFEIDGAIP